MSSNMKELRRSLQAAGWRIEQCKKHFKCYHPLGGFIVTSGSPSDGNAHKAAEREVRKLEREKGYEETPL